MDKSALVERSVEAGKSLIAELDRRSSVPIRSAFWNYSDETGWKLVLASPIVRDRRGLQNAYREVHKALSTIPDTDLSVSDVALVADTDPVVRLLAGAVSTGPTSLSRIRFKGNSINGVFIEDALIYRST